ncbi:MAG TPA: divalent metal cation transporter [Ideonella sp.]|nr:divalent metal cation transporter [Ideonella sp.]
MGRDLFNDVGRRIGPGLITGAADDDPSGIATYSQAGAQFGYALVWTLLLTTPLMIGVQMLSARIGWATREGLAANLAKLLPHGLALALVALLVLANTLNIAADIGAMAQAVGLLAGGPPALWVLGFGALCAGGQLLFSYESALRTLKWLTLSLLSYVAVVLAVHVPLHEVLAGTVHPWQGLGQRFAAADYASMVVAVFGTTISPYLFFWQAAQEVEDDRRRPEAAALHDQPAYAAEHLARIKEDTWIGMLFSNGVALCIMLATAVTLAGQGLTTIHTAAQAAEALRPLAGEFAFADIALGIVGTGLLAVPVLAGSAAYAVSDLFGWPAGASHDLRQARGFHAIVMAATLLGLRRAWARPMLPRADHFGANS